MNSVENRHDAHENKEIDVSEAMAILSLRAAEQHGKHVHLNGTSTDTLTGSCNASAATGVSLSDANKSRGQTIQLFESPSNGDDNDNTSRQDLIHADSCIQKDFDEKKMDRRQMEEESRKREIDMRSHLETLGVVDLLLAVLEAQRERTAAYREFDRCLVTALETKNLTGYPFGCAKATASFAVLSRSVKAIGDVCKRIHGKKNLSSYIDDLQRGEEEKLYVTAALHLERMRSTDGLDVTALCGPSIITEINGSGGGESEKNDDRTANLLRDGVAQLREKEAECVAKINEVLEELRYAIAEARQEEDLIGETL